MYAFVYLFLFIYLFLAHCQVRQVGLLREKGLDIGRRSLPAPVVHLCKIPYFADYYRN